MSAVQAIQYLIERDKLQEKLNLIQQFLNYQSEHCTDTIDENAPGCKRAPDIYKLGIFNNTQYIKYVIECIIKGIEVDFH